MSRPSLIALYFVLTFLAGAAVGSWVLWIYLIGFPSQQPIASEPAAAVVEPKSPAVTATAPAPSAAAGAAPAETTLPAATAPPPTNLPQRDVQVPRAQDAQERPPPRGHWNTVDIPPRSHEECLALTKELNDEYKDCRFGVHKEVWVAE